VETPSISETKKKDLIRSSIKKLFSFKKKITEQNLHHQISNTNHYTPLSPSINTALPSAHNPTSRVSCFTHSLHKINSDFPFELEFASGRELHLWKNEFSNWFSYLDEYENAKSAIIDYTSDIPKNREINHAHLNFYLRTKTLSPKEKHLKKAIIAFDHTLQDTLSRANMPCNTIVYRKISDELLMIYSKGKDLSHLTEGDILVEDGYMSTSLSRQKVEKICIHGQIILKIKVPQGTHGGYINDITATKGEEEVLFNKNQHLKITKLRDTRKINGFWLIECNLLPFPTANDLGKHYTHRKILNYDQK
jgi:hypothetical protein